MAHPPPVEIHICQHCIADSLIISILHGQQCGKVVLICIPPSSVAPLIPASCLDGQQNVKLSCLPNDPLEVPYTSPEGHKHLYVVRVPKCKPGDAAIASLSLGYKWSLLHWSGTACLSPLAYAHHICLACREPIFQLDYKQVH